MDRNTDVTQRGPVPLFVELCAGTAALSLRLQRSGARPPVSRMGAKTGYADAILSRMGLHAGQGAHHFVWCEPDAGCRLLLHAYTSPELARSAAAIIRGWADQEPRALWEKLRAEGPARCPPSVDPREVARAARLLTSNRLINLDSATWKNTGAGGTTHGGDEFCTPIESLADAFDGLADPREVARAVFVAGNMAPGQDRWGGGGGKNRPCNLSAAGLSRSLVGDPDMRDRWTCPPIADLGLQATIADDAREVAPDRLPAGTWAYIDGPYEGTSGYADLLPRAEVVALALRWDAAGASVCVSEAVPVAELVALGWHAVEITHQRHGQKRTFSKQQHEWLTMNRTPRGQLDLFGVTE